MAVAKELWSQDKRRGCPDPRLLERGGSLGSRGEGGRCRSGSGPIPAPLLSSKTFRKKFSGFDLRLFCSKISANVSRLRTPCACADPSGSAFPPGLGSSTSLHARGRWAPHLLSLCSCAWHLRSSGSVLAGVGEGWGFGGLERVVPNACPASCNPNGAESSLDKHPPPVPRCRVQVSARLPCGAAWFQPSDSGTGLPPGSAQVTR